MDMSENRGAEGDISVHLVLYVKKAMVRTEIYDILTKSNKVTSVDFL